MAYEFLEVSREGSVGVIRRNRPEKLNAWSQRMGVEERAAIEAFNQDPDVAAIVMAGNGRAFCAGLDLAAQSRAVDEGTAGESVDRAAAAPESWVDFCRRSKPLIAAVHGYAVGVGATLALPFDFRIAAESAQFGFRFVKVGLVPEAASTALLPQLAGVAHALDACLTGRFIGAEEAFRWGLVREIVPEDRLLEAALQLGEELAANPAPHLRRIKELFAQSALESDMTLVQQREGEALRWAYATAEHKEAITAFLEKREPRFR